MRLDENSNKIVIGVSELVAIAKRRIAPIPTGFDEQTDGTIPALPISVGGREYLLRADGYTLLDGTVSVRGDGDGIKSEAGYVRGCGFILGYMYATATGAPEVTVEAEYKKTKGKTEAKTERVSKARLDSFFHQCLDALAIWGEPEAERVTQRIPSMQKASFPYPERRGGQDEFIKKVYKNLTRGGTLYACAPTGTGKTVSVLYPALRALGKGALTKVFYLTPKTTAARAAAECLELMARGGTQIRAIHLPSKERCCHRGVLCRDGADECELSKCEALHEGVMALYRLGKAVVGSKECTDTAKQFGLCPHELALTYSELCDVVICDCNYLFDPAVYIRRYFDSPGKYAFLIDEAHNLGERATEMYSCELRLSELSALCDSPLLGEHSTVVGSVRELCSELKTIAMDYLSEDIREGAEGQKVGATTLTEVPSAFYDLIDGHLALCEEELHRARRAKDEDARPRIALLREHTAAIRAASRALRLFDYGYRIFLFYEDGEINIKLFSLDTGRLIGERLRLGCSAVFFSATLTPTDYYRDTLGGDGSSDVLEVGSPFAPEQLSVSIVDKISIRFSERERTLPAVCRTVAATMSAKRGNYMVFCPSFEYAEMLSRSFTAKYPRIRTLTQHRNMTRQEKSDFLAAFTDCKDGYLVGFCVLGGIYSEGIDLVGESLIGAVVVGIGIPALSYEREAMAAYYEDRYEAGKQYAYIYPGMNRVFQAAGRVIRTEDDRGVIVLIDDRFADPIYKKSIPDLWRDMAYVPDAKTLKERILEFWSEDGE